MRMTSILGVTVLGVVSLAAHDAAADFRSGLSAYNGGDYTSALAEWLPLAERGEPDAEAGVGFLFHKGLGVPQDNAKAAIWFTKAAEQGQPEGQLMLGTLFFYGLSVPRSYVAAFAWCELAQGNGQADAGECRDAALEHMTADEMARSFKLVRDWRQRHQ